MRPCLRKQETTKEQTQSRTRPLAGLRATLRVAVTRETEVGGLAEQHGDLSQKTRTNKKSSEYKATRTRKKVTPNSGDKCLPSYIIKEVQLNGEKL